MLNKAKEYAKSAYQATKSAFSSAANTVTSAVSKISNNKEVVSPEQIKLNEAKIAELGLQSTKVYTKVNTLLESLNKSAAEKKLSEKDKSLLLKQFSSFAHMSDEIKKITNEISACKLDTEAGKNSDIAKRLNDISSNLNAIEDKFNEHKAKIDAKAFEDKKFKVHVGVTVAILAAFIAGAVALLVLTNPLIAVAVFLAAPLALIIANKAISEFMVPKMEKAAQIEAAKPAVPAKEVTQEVAKAQEQVKNADHRKLEAEKQALNVTGDKAQGAAVSA